MHRDEVQVHQMMQRPTTRGWHTTAAAALVGVSMLAGCSASADYEAAPSEQPTTSEIPRWIRDGVRIARATKAAREGGGTDTSGGLTIGGGTGSTTETTLPPRADFVAALTAAGLTEQQSGCVYDSVASSPQTAADVSTLLAGLAATSGATVEPSAVPTLANLTPESTNRVLLAVVPCLDQQTIVALLAAGQGLGAGSGTGDPLAALLASAQGLDLSALAGLDQNAIAQAVAGALGPQQVQQVQALLAAVGTAQQGLATDLAKLDPSKLDISKLDLKNLTKEQLPVLVLALVGGLSQTQQSQLSDLVQVNLAQLNIKIDPDDLTPEEVGSLLLILSPVLAGAIKPTPSSPPAGEDPNQVYIPPGADLSNINPLVFLNRADVVAQFERQGVDPALGTCLFDGMARLSATTLAAFFTEDGTPAAIGSVLLIAISCIVQQR